MSRLATLDPTIARWVKTQTVDRLREVTVAVVARALEENGLSEWRLAEALCTLASGRRPAAAREEAIFEAVRVQDEIAWEAHQAGSDREYIIAFRQARAMAALGFACQKDSRAAVAEAIYEAQASLGGLAELADELELLRGV